MELEPKNSKGNMLGVPEFGVLSNSLDLVFDVLKLSSYFAKLIVHCIDWDLEDTSQAYKVILW